MLGSAPASSRARTKRWSCFAEANIKALQPEWSSNASRHRNQQNQPEPTRTNRNPKISSASGQWKSMKSQGDPTKACFNAAGFENFHGKKMFGICHAQAMAPSYTWKISPPLPRIGHPSLQQCATMRSQESTSWANLKGEAGEAHQGSNFDLTRTSIYFSATFPTSTLFLTSNIWDRGLPDVWFVVLVSIPFSLLDHLSLFDSLLDLFGLMKVCQASVASCSPLFSSKFPPPSPHHPRKQRPRTSHCSPAVQALATADLALRIAMEASLGETKSLWK